jgi:hypothetical protein
MALDERVRIPLHLLLLGAPELHFSDVSAKVQVDISSH